LLHINTFREDVAALRCDLDFGLPIKNARLISQKAPSQESGDGLGGGEEDQEDIKSSYLALNNPTRALAYGLPMVTLITINMFYASRVVAKGRRVVGYSMAFGSIFGWFCLPWLLGHV
jgi:hypothetical protein